MSKKQGVFKVWQNGEIVAQGYGPIDKIRLEAERYGLIYSEDGPVRISIKEVKGKAK
jgi:hypothetical protein